MLELERVVKHYRGAGEEVRAVDGVSLAIAPGEMVALHGPSGSGKTTLLLLIAALLKPEQGAIRYDGRDLSSLSENEACDYLMRDVGFIYQSFHLMPRVSALENASMKLLLGGVGMREAQARAVPWLERVGLGERLERTPEELSGGERQRVAIARALAGEPRLILADEPTGNLDSARSREIVELLRSIAHEREAAVLLVTHDLEAAAIADRRCTLRDGRLSEGHSRQRGARAPPHSRPLTTPGVSGLASAPSPSQARALDAALRASSTSTAAACACTPPRSCSPASGWRSPWRSCSRSPSPTTASRARQAKWSTRSSGPRNLQLRARGPDGFDERLLARVEHLPGVKQAAPLLEQTATIVGPNGRRVTVDLAGTDVSLATLDGLAHTLPIAALSPGGIGLSKATAEANWRISPPAPRQRTVSLQLRGTADPLKVDRRARPRSVRRALAGDGGGHAADDACSGSPGCRDGSRASSSQTEPGQRSQPCARSCKRSLADGSRSRRPTRTSRCCARRCARATRRASSSPRSARCSGSCSRSTRCC